MENGFKTTYDKEYIDNKFEEITSNIEDIERNYTTDQEVNEIIEGKGYTTEEQVSQMINQSVITALNTEV